MCANTAVIKAESRESATFLYSRYTGEIPAKAAGQAKKRGDRLGKERYGIMQARKLQEKRNKSMNDLQVVEQELSDAIMREMR